MTFVNKATFKYLNQMNVNIRPTSIPGCLEINPITFIDNRGAFIKTFNADTFKSLNLETNFVEEYFSISVKNVLRGLHFQLPPKDCVKIVYCMLGEVIDVILDLRIGSPTYGQHEVFNLNDRNASILYLPSGIAHGFYTKSDRAIMMYNVSQTYSTELDTGIHWNSAGINWIDSYPIISERDDNFIALDLFESPFKFNQQEVYAIYT
jgi:dTDP-4-dehydrorhamnose 3,5-epimerase